MESVPLIYSVAMTPKNKPLPQEVTLDELFLKIDNYLLMTNVLIKEA